MPPPPPSRATSILSYGESCVTCGTGWWGDILAYGNGCDESDGGLGFFYVEFVGGCKCLVFWFCLIIRDVLIC